MMYFFLRTFMAQTCLSCKLRTNKTLAQVPLPITDKALQFQIPPAFISKIIIYLLYKNCKNIEQSDFNHILLATFIYILSSIAWQKIKANSFHRLLNNFVQQASQPIYNKLMLQPKQIEMLYQLLNAKEHCLEEIQDRFLLAFSDDLSVFQASQTMNRLINHNVLLSVQKLLTLQQRIITLFILIENYNTEGIKKNPFGATILNISLKTYEGFQRRMISDLILEGKRQKYAKIPIAQLLDDEQLMIELTPERPEIIKLREEFITQLPQIPQTRSSQLNNVIPDLNQRSRILQPPEEFTRNPIKEKLCFNGDLKLGVMRPIPKFIQIDPFQVNWLSPGIVGDVHWDNSFDTQKKFAKYKGYIKKGLQSKLSKEQSTEIQRCLQNQAYCVLNLDVTPQNLILLIKNNPSVAASFLTKLGNYPIAGDYLQGLLDCGISLSCIDVMVRLLKSSKVPVPFVEAFALKYMKQVQLLDQNYKDLPKMVRVICNFIVCLMRNKIVIVHQFTPAFNQFINHFKQIEDLHILDKLLTIVQSEKYSK